MTNLPPRETAPDHIHLFQRYNQGETKDGFLFRCISACPDKREMSLDESVYLLRAGLIEQVEDACDGLFTVRKKAECRDTLAVTHREFLEAYNKLTGRATQLPAWKPEGLRSALFDVASQGWDVVALDWSAICTFFKEEMDRGNFPKKHEKWIPTALLDQYRGVICGWTFPTPVGAVVLVWNGVWCE
jgi:hypothetical protein